MRNNRRTSLEILFICGATAVIALLPVRALGEDGLEQLNTPKPEESLSPLPKERWGREHREHRRRADQEQSDDRRGPERAMRDERFQRMGKFFGVVNEFQGAVGQPGGAVSLALMGIKQYYKKNGKPEEAISFFEDTLKGVQDRKMRNIILFTIRQLYEEQKDAEKFLAINKRILQENIQAASAGR